MAQNHLIVGLSSDFKAEDFEIIAIPYTDKNKARIQLALYAKSHKLDHRTCYWMDDSDDIEDVIEAIIKKHVHEKVSDFMPESHADEDIYSYRVELFIEILEDTISNIRAKYERGDTRISDLLSA